MLDVGRERPAPVMPDASLSELKERLEDPVRYFLGNEFEAVLYPGADAEYYGLPPSKNYVLESVSDYRWRADGFKPLASFAQGGLAQAWTGGSYPFNDAELSDFPFAHRDIGPYYDLVARRIGISGAVDDLARFMPVHDHLQPPLDLDEHSRVLLGAYEKRRQRLNDGRGCYMGRSRIATISRDHNGRRACDYKGRCLWGCPSYSLYTPGLTLDECLRFDRFRYQPGVYVSHFEIDGQHRVRTVVARTRTGSLERVPADTLVLGAGALSSCRIFLESIYRSTGQRVALTGLMDNQQILMPFVNLPMIGRRYDPNSYQYHQIGLGLEADRPHEYVHGQITTLKTALIHPLVQTLPFDFKTALSLFRNLHAALGLVNVNLHDTRRATNTLTLEPGERDAPGRLLIHYQVAPEQAEQIRSATRRVRGALLSLNCVVAPGKSHVRPMGASVHYAGLLPMTDKAAPWTTTSEGQSRDVENLFFADGTTFPFLPAKNLTFTLMANAARIADRAF
jgi:hypothetical protein